MLSPRAKAAIAGVVALAVAALIAAIVATVKAQDYRERTGEGLGFAYVIPLWLLAGAAIIAALIISAVVVRRTAEHEHDQRRASAGR